MEKLGKVVQSIKEFDVSSVANHKVVVCLAVIGLAATVKTLWAPVSSMIAKEDNLKHKSSYLRQKYQGQWALITDGNESQGQQLAIELAREGYNIIFVVSGEDDITDILEQAAGIYKVQTRIIKSDITKNFTLENLQEFEKVFDEIDADISVVINNIEIKGNHQQMIITQEQELQHMNEHIKVSIASQFFQSKVLIPRLLQRYEKTKVKSAIVNLNQQMDDLDLKASIYTSTKAAQFIYGLGLIEQYGDKIDILTARPKDQLPEINLERAFSKVMDPSLNRQNSDVERAKQIQEELDKIEFEYVPLQMIYQQQKQLQAHDSSERSFGQWPFRKNIK